MYWWQGFRRQLHPALGGSQAELQLLHNLGIGSQHGLGANDHTAAKVMEGMPVSCASLALAAPTSPSNWKVAVQARRPPGARPVGGSKASREPGCTRPGSFAGPAAGHEMDMS